MYTKIKILALMLTMALFTTTGVYAATGDTTSTGTTASSGATTTSDKFSMKSVEVVDARTLKISFNRDLFEDTSMFEFLLTNKKDDKTDIALTGITLSSAKELTANTLVDLLPNEDYNIVVVFASDKDGNGVENGVDALLEFKTPETLTPAQATAVDATAATTTEAVEPTEDLNAAPAQAITTAAVTGSGDLTSSGQTAEVAAGDAKALPETGAKEMFVILFAMILGLGFMYARRKA